MSDEGAEITWKTNLSGSRRVWGCVCVTVFYFAKNVFITQVVFIVRAEEENICYQREGLTVTLITPTMSILVVTERKFLLWATKMSIAIAEKYLLG